MKRWKKVLLIISAVAASAGICCILVGVALEARLHDVKQLILDDFYSIHGDWNHDWMLWPAQESGVYKTGDTVSGESGTQSSSSYSNVKDMELETGCGQIRIQYYEGQEVKVEAENISPKRFSSGMDGDTLVVKDKTKKAVLWKGAVITVYIPKNMELGETKLKIGAGSANVEALCTREVRISVGAGQIDIAGIDADKVKLNCGAGRINAVLSGTQSDYRLKGGCGLGQINFGESSFTAFAKKVFRGSGDRLVEANCGVGQIDIQFDGA